MIDEIAAEGYEDEAVEEAKAEAEDAAEIAKDEQAQAKKLEEFRFPDDIMA